MIKAMYVLIVSFSSMAWAADFNPLGQYGANTEPGVSSPQALSACDDGNTEAAVGAGSAACQDDSAFAPPKPAAADQPSDSGEVAR